MQTASTRVLLVEDEALDALAVTRSLRPQEGQERFDVRCTRTLAQGLEQLERDRVDVVILDLCLPDSEAAETVARLRALDRRTPLVVFTGCEDAELTARAFEAGADDLLVKDHLDAGQLRRTIRHAIERRRGARAAPLAPARRRGDEGGRSLLHHLKNVQTCILGNAQILQRELPAGFLRERVDSLVDAARSATELIRQLADGANEGDELADLSDLVRRAEPLLRAVAPDAIELGLRLARGLPPVRTGGVEALGRALLELVVNACEALGGGPGRIEVATGLAVLEASELPELVADAGIEPGPHAWLEVRDDGPGIGPDARARLFDPGFSTKGTRRGHGLAEVRWILARERGGLRVASRPGEGAAFRILLPIAGSA